MASLPQLPIWLIAISLLTAYLIASRAQAYYRLRHIPGPFWARWGHLWLVRQMLRGNYIDGSHELHAEYGPVVLLAPGFVSVSDPAEVRRIHAFRSPWDRAKEYTGMRMEPGADSLFVARDRRLHERLRAMAAPAYLGKEVDGVHELISGHVMELVELIGSRYATSTTTTTDGDTDAAADEYRPMDFAKVVTYMTMDIISCLSLGECFKCMEREADIHGYIQALADGMPAFAAVAIHPWFQAIMGNALMAPIMPKGGFMQPILAIAKRAVAARFDGEAGPRVVERRDMLNCLVANGLSQRQLEVETVVQLAAGSDTTSTAIRGTMLFLLTSPRVYHRLRAEIDDAVVAGRIPAASPVSDAEARRLPYLQAVIKEGLRVFPPASIVPKSSPKDDVVCGLRIPAGVSVDIGMKSALRDKGVFGEDAEVFRPERWIGAGPERLRAMEETSRFLWGGPSRWECLGKGMALEQMNILFVELFRRFDFAIVNPATPWKTTGTRIWIISDMFVRVTHREQATRS